MRRNMKITRVYLPNEGASHTEIWLCNILNRSGFSCILLAEKCHVSRQFISSLLNGKYKCTFPMVCAICHATGLDNPEAVWNYISNDSEDKLE